MDDAKVDEKISVSQIFAETSATTRLQKVPIKKESLVERENSRFKRGIEPNVAGVENETTRQLDNVFPRFLFLHDNTVSWSTFKSIRNLCSLTSSKAVLGAEGGKGHRRVTSALMQSNKAL